MSRFLDPKDENLLLCKNLMARVIESERTGTFSLRGDISRREYRALDFAIGVLENYAEGKLVQAQTLSDA